MSQAVSGRAKKKSGMAEESPLSKLIRVILLILFDVGVVWFAQNALSKGFDQLVVVIGIIAVMFNLIFLLPQAYPFRWMAFGLGFLILFTNITRIGLVSPSPSLSFSGC